MTTPRPETDPVPTGVNHDPAHSPGHDDRGRHGGHGLMVMLMCVPMLLIAGLLVVSGAAGTGALFALVCVAMMAGMMLMMPGGRSHE